MQARQDAHALMQAGLPDGAANRAYYAMFSATRAALAVPAEEAQEPLKLMEEMLQALGPLLGPQGARS